MFDLLRHNESQKYIVYDFETCHLSLASLDNKPWQLGLLECQGSKVLSKHNLFIHWDNLKMSKGAAEVTRFDERKYRNWAKPTKECLDFFENYLYNSEYLILAHNQLAFDIFIHNIFRKNLGLKSDWSYLSRVLDTNSLARGIKLNQQYHGPLGNDFLAYQFRMSRTMVKGLKTNLTQLGKEQKINDINYEELHCGVKDCELLFKIWNRWIKWNINI